MLHFNNLLSSFSFFLIFFFFSTNSSLQSSLNNASSLVKDSCNYISKSDSNVEYNFCVTTLASDPRSATADTSAHLGSISYQLGVNKTISISLKVANLLKDPKFDPSAKDALKACSNAYLDAQHALQESLKAFENGDYSKTYTIVQDALSVPSACESGFKVSPLTQENSDFSQLASICLDFIELVLKG